MNSSTFRHDSNATPPRLVAEKQLPPYSYVPGKFPHPLGDPQGHSFGAVEPVVTIADESDWRHCDAYLWGIDLFNRGYYWEAHESWEAVWHATGRRGTIADFCKALIKLAAAGVKAREGRPDGVKRHALRAVQLLAKVAIDAGASSPRFMGLHLAVLKQQATALAADPHAIINTSNEPVVVMMPFKLAVAMN